MKYQLVIQFPEELFKNVDWIADIEDRLDELLIDSEVDGHDIGSGETNIFIHTNNPINTFAIIKNIFEEDGFDFENLKITYREMNGNTYIPLWPEDLVDFKVL